MDPSESSKAVYPECRSCANYSWLSSYKAQLCRNLNTQFILYSMIPEDPDTNRTAKDLTAGSIGGIAQVLTGQPFDIVKVRLQSAPPGRFSGALDVVRQIFYKEGPLAFYKGTLTPLLGVGACVSVQFSVNEAMKRFYASQGVALGNAQYYTCGLFAGVANGFLASPIEHVRIRLQTQTNKAYKGPLDVATKLLKTGGITSLMRGLGPTLIREGQGMGVYFMTFESLVERTMKHDGIARKDIPGWKLCVFGGLAGYSMWFAVYPVDVIKSRLQTDNISNPEFRNGFSVAKHIYKVDGVKGFFRGFAPTILRAAPANAATFLAFESAMRLLD